MLKTGDVVFGCFAVKGETLADHHSVVVDVMGDMALLVYTTSIKPGEPVTSRRYSAEFSKNDCTFANWKNRCRYDGSRVSIVPVSMVEVTGRVPAATVTKIVEQITLAKRGSTFECARYDSAHPERRTGYVSRVKREAAFL
jgi:hypothetical protein